MPLGTNWKALAKRERLERLRLDEALADAQVRYQALRTKERHAYHQGMADMTVVADCTHELVHQAQAELDVVLELLAKDLTDTAQGRVRELIVRLGQEVEGMDRAIRTNGIDYTYRRPGTNGTGDTHTSNGRKTDGTHTRRPPARRRTQ